MHGAWYLREICAFAHVWTVTSTCCGIKTQKGQVVFAACWRWRTVSLSLTCSQETVKTSFNGEMAPEFMIFKGVKSGRMCQQHELTGDVSFSIYNYLFSQESTETSLHTWIQTHERYILHHGLNWQHLWHCSIKYSDELPLEAFCAFTTNGRRLVRLRITKSPGNGDHQLSADAKAYFHEHCVFLCGFLWEKWMTCNGTYCDNKLVKIKKHMNVVGTRIILSWCSLKVILGMWIFEFVCIHDCVSLCDTNIFVTIRTKQWRRQYYHFMCDLFTQVRLKLLWHWTLICLSLGTLIWDTSQYCTNRICQTWIWEETDRHTQAVNAQHVDFEKVGEWGAGDMRGSAWMGAAGRVLDERVGGDQLRSAEEHLPESAGQGLGAGLPCRSRRHHHTPPNSPGTR